MKAALPTKKWLLDLRRLAGEEAYGEGQKLHRRKAVRDVLLWPGRAMGTVTVGGGAHTVMVAWDRCLFTTCTCYQDAPCAHVVAVTLMVMRRPQACLDAELIKERIGSMTRKELGLLLFEALEMRPDLWRKLNPPALDRDGTMNDRVRRVWQPESDDVVGQVAELEGLLDDSFSWDLRPGGPERMILILDILASLLAACQRGADDVVVESELLRSNCWDHLGSIVTDVDEAEAQKGMQQALQLLQADRFGLRMDEVLLNFAQVVGAKHIVDQVSGVVAEGRVPAAVDNGAWLDEFRRRAEAESAHCWPEGDRSERSDRAAGELERLLVSGLGRRYEREAAQEAVDLLPLWKLNRYLERMKADPRDRQSWFSILCARDPGMALRFAGPDVADLDVDMLGILMINLEDESAALQGAEWAEKRLRAGGTRRSEIVRVLGSVRVRGGEENWCRLRKEMVARSQHPQKVEAALDAAEERHKHFAG
jgi:hypothetical protein